MIKTVYLYDPATLKPIGSYDCQPSPLEPGEFITPEYSLPTPPPVAGPGKVTLFNRVDDWIVVDTPIPSDADILAAKAESYRLAVRQHMTAVARAAPEHFNSISEAKSFVGTDNPYAAVSAAFQVWAAAVQVASNATLDDALAGNTPLPELSALIASLPAWVHP